MGEQRVQQMYEFGPFRLDTRERVLLRDGRPLPLKPKVYETLLALISQSGHVVDKEELMRRVWPDVVVEENNLTGNIYALRRAFAEFQYIETVPRRGYRFTAEVKRVQVADGKVANRSGAETEVLIKETTARHRQAIDSLAVLPFINASADPDAEYLSDGITESIINNLSQLPQLRVIARSTVFRYKGRESDAQAVGRELSVGAVLLGRVLQFSERLIIRTELVDVESGYQLWGEQYNRNLIDIFAVQEEIAREISETLRLKLRVEELRLLAKRSTENTAAYHTYLKGRYYWNKRTGDALKKAVQYFQEAIETDPVYALAYAGLADCYTTLGWWRVLPPAESFPKATAAAVKALEIDQTLAEAHTSLAHVKLNYDRDWTAAERGFNRAIESNPHYATAHHWRAEYLAATGKLDEAVAADKRALELEPLSLIINSGMGLFLYWARCYDEAIAQLQKALEMDPHFTAAHFFIGLAYVQMEMYEKAIAEFQQSVTLSGDNPLMIASLAHAYASSGKQSKAQKIIEALTHKAETDYVSPLDVAIIYAGMGAKAQAFEWLEKAYKERSAWLVFIGIEPRLDPLRSDSRFTELLRRIDLVALKRGFQFSAEFQQ
jgi:TolB-like protein/Tfp pilus assembly protein PilF